MPDVTLTGLDGTNPFGFMGALGVLASMTSAMPETRLAWKHEGEWRPVLTSPLANLDALVSALDAERQRCLADPALSLEYERKKDLKPPPGCFRKFLSQLVVDASENNDRSVAWASAFATDIAVDNNGNTKPTALHFTAGQQQFLQMVLELATNVTGDDLREAVEGPWRYERSLPVMGWDATSSRDYALRASDPSTDKKRGVPGADWLAIRGLTFLPTVPRGNRVMTTGCVGGWKSGRFRWPIWEVPLSAPVVASVLRLSVEEMTMPERRGRGIAAVFSSGIKRSDQGGYGSFEPASVV